MQYRREIYDGVADCCEHFDDAAGCFGQAHQGHCVQSLDRLRASIMSQRLGQWQCPELLRRKRSCWRIQPGIDSLDYIASLITGEVQHAVDLQQPDALDQSNKQDRKSVV